MVIPVRFGVPTDVFFDMQTVSNSSFVATGEFGAGGESDTFPAAFLQYICDLRWGDQTWVTDTGGRVLRNLSIGSDVGFDYHLGDFTPPDAVPEPATWALMIGGIGLAGAQLRRRRACEPTFFTEEPDGSLARLHPSAEY